MLAYTILLFICLLTYATSSSAFPHHCYMPFNVFLCDIILYSVRLQCKLWHFNFVSYANNGGFTLVLFLAFKCPHIRTHYSGPFYDILYLLYYNKLNHNNYQCVVEQRHVTLIIAVYYNFTSCQAISNYAALWYHVMHVHNYVTAMLWYTMLCNIMLTNVKLFNITYLYILHIHSSCSIEYMIYSLL